MRKIAILLVFSAVLGACKSHSVEIVPKPVSLIENGGTVRLSEDLTFNAGSPELMELVSTWEESLAPIANAGPTKTKMRADVLLLIDEELEREEYNLVVANAPNKVVISGGSSAGVWWGMQTLAQLLNQSRTDNGFKVPCVSISDKPLFKIRSGMLDCSGRYYDLDAVKNFIDILSLHKLNTFHWHFADDHGWRIEIKKYPRLTEVGAYRKETVIGVPKNKMFDGIPHGGFYTQEEIKEVVKYAADRQITIIPEIEMPGHCLAALASYPELGCLGKGYEVSTIWGIKKDIFCAGNEKVLQFLKDVFDEVCELFPGEYIHVGGDEVKTDRWEECPKCQAKMRKLGLKKPEELHGYMLREIEEYLNAKGKKIIGWDEILDAGVSQTATIMSWRGTEGGIRAAKQGNHAIMVPYKHFYFDRFQTRNPDAVGEPLSFHGSAVPFSSSYLFDPFEGLEENERQYIIGIQACLWAGYIVTPKLIQVMFLPRCCGLSEVAWGSEKEDFEVFSQRCRNVMAPLYETLGLNYAKYGFDE